MAGLFSKDHATRLDETVAYLRGVDAPLATEVSRLVANSGAARQIGEDITLSGTTSLLAEDRDNNTQGQRHALRALLLLQRVYLTDVWAPGRMMARRPFVPHGTWPDRPVRHWRYRPEPEIRDAIRMYTTMNHASHHGLARAAANRSGIADDWDVTRRGSPTPPTGASCYDQVSNWLLAAGFVSLRWMARYRPQNNNFTEFGAGTEWIRQTDPVPAAPFRIPRGMIVRMFTDRRPGGHFMISEGDGRGWGYNNAPKAASAEEPLVPNGHARCLIHRQFADYRERDDAVNGHFGGKLVLIDPERIPNAC